MREGELQKLMWEKLKGHMIDSGEITEAEAKAIFSEIVDEARKEFYGLLSAFPTIKPEIEPVIKKWFGEKKREDE